MQVGDYILNHDQVGPLTIWKWPDPDLLYCIGADSCGGMRSGDSAAAHVVRADTGDLVAVFHDKLEPADFAVVLNDLGRYYGGRDPAAFMVPENNNHGHATVLRLRDLAYPCLFFRVSWDSIQQKEVTKFGWATTPQTRSIMLSAGQEALKDPEVGIPHIPTLEEMLNFIFNDSGKAEAAPGETDDCVISFSLAQVGRRFLKLPADFVTKEHRMTREQVAEQIVAQGREDLVESREVARSGWI